MWIYALLVSQVLACIRDLWKPNNCKGNSYTSINFPPTCNYYVIIWLLCNNVEASVFAISIICFRTRALIIVMDLAPDRMDDFFRSIHSLPSLGLLWSIHVQRIPLTVKKDNSNYLASYKQVLISFCSQY